MERGSNLSLLSKVNCKCVLKGLFYNIYIIYVAKCTLCYAIYIGNTQKPLKNIINGNFSDVLCIIKNRQKSDSFAAHYNQLFKYNTPRNYLHSCMILKVVKRFNNIGAMELFTKYNCILCAE